MNADSDIILFGQPDILLFDFKIRGSSAVVLLVCFETIIKCNSANLFLLSKP